LIASDDSYDREAAIRHLMEEKAGKAKQELMIVVEILEEQLGAVEGRRSSWRMEDYYNRTNKAPALFPSDD
jgi:hypothetical protein